MPLAERKGTMKAKKVRGSPRNHAILPRKGERMTEQRKKWEYETQRLFKIKVSRISEKDMVEFIESKDSINGYLKGLVKADMDTDKAWAICMGVRIGAEYARTFKWVKLGEELVELANELGQKLGLAPDEVFRQAHQVMERERL